MADDGRVLRARSSLKMRNVRIGQRRTSLRLERPVWDALAEIVRRENTTLNLLLTRIADEQSESSFTASVRVYTLGYFRRMAERLEAH